MVDLERCVKRLQENSYYGAHPKQDWIATNTSNHDMVKEAFINMVTDYTKMYKHAVRVRVNGNCYYSTECWRYVRPDGDEYKVCVKVNPELIAPDDSLNIKNVIFNPPATIVYWEDGSKTVVKCQDGDDYDPEKGITMAFFKRMHGNKGHYYEEIKKWVPEEKSISREVVDFGEDFGKGFRAGILNAINVITGHSKTLDIKEGDNECQSN